MTTVRTQSTILPVGDAVARLVQVQYTLLAAPGEVKLPALQAELEQLQQALNAFSVNLRFACKVKAKLGKEPPIPQEPTSLHLLKQQSEDSCCRVVQALRSPANKSLKSLGASALPKIETPVAERRSEIGSSRGR